MVKLGIHSGFSNAMLHVRTTTRVVKVVSIKFLAVHQTVIFLLLFIFSFICLFRGFELECRRVDDNYVGAILL